MDIQEFQNLRYFIIINVSFNQLLFEMRFLLIFTKKSVPQWNNCYYDYVNIKGIIVMCKKAYAISCNIEDLARLDNYISEQSTSLIINGQALDQVCVSSRQKILTLMKNADCLFYRYHSMSKRVVYLFFQYKIHQLNQRLNKYNIWYNHAQSTKYLVTQLLSNCYLQKNKLTTMTQLHIQAYDKIHKKHQKCFKNFGLNTPAKKTARLARTLQDLSRYRSKLDITLHQHPEITEQYNRFYIDEEIQASPFKTSLFSYLFGLFNGFSICIFIASIILLATNIKEDDISRIIFGNQYRLWKCLGFVILYIWVFAISFYIFEKKRINYSLIFGYKFQKKDKSVSRLATATLMFLIWCSLFVFYAMDLIGIYPVAQVSDNPKYPITIFFPIIIFGLLVLFGLYEIVYTSRGTMFFLFTFLKVFLTLFGFYQIDFSVVWITEQIVSLVQLIQNIIYSFCYYSQLLQTPDTTDNSCFSVIITAESLIIAIFSIRLIQSLVVAYKNRRFLFTREMMRFIRASLYISLAALSIASKSSSTVLIVFQAVLAFISGVFSFFVDVFIDWNLFQIQNGKIIKREEHLFSMHIIYFMIGYNFLARMLFPFTFCLQFIFHYIPHPEVILTIAGAFELGRRLIWNILRVENEQVKNNYFFQVRTDYQDKQIKIMNQLKNLNLSQIYKQSPIQKERSENQLINLRSTIRSKNEMRFKILQFVAKTDHILQEIEYKAEQEILKIVDANRQ